jgi:hypothetical protein
VPTHRAARFQHLAITVRRSEYRARTVARPFPRAADLVEGGLPHAALLPTPDAKDRAGGSTNRADGSFGGGSLRADSFHRGARLNKVLPAQVVQERGERAHEALEMAEPQSAESKPLNFGQREFGGPVLARDSITGDEYSGSFGASPAMDEHFPVRIVVKQLEELRYLLRTRRVPAVPRNADVPHVVRVHQRVLPGNLAGLMPQVHDDVDSQMFQFRKPGVLWLAAPGKAAG